MSKRYGRNQKRRAREQVKTLNRMVLDGLDHGEAMARKIADLTIKLSDASARLRDLEGVDRRFVLEHLAVEVAKVWAPEVLKAARPLLEPAELRVYNSTDLVTNEAIVEVRIPEFRACVRRPVRFLWS